MAENISRTGLLVRCYSADFGGAGAPGEPVQMQLEISSEGKLKKRILDCQGSVAWREAEPLGDVLLGLSVSKMRFRSTPQDGSPLSLWNSDGELVM